MRAYFFGNFYLSSIQQGIQAMHCISEMFIKYAPGDFSLDPIEEGVDDFCDRYDMLHEWARDHKTSILLNGGDNNDLHDLAIFLDNEDNWYPYAMFWESDRALKQAITCVGIILPEKIYDVADELRKTPFSKRDDLLNTFGMNGFEHTVIAAINGSRLAR